MSLREILTVPDPRLKQVSAPVEGVDDALRELMDDMLETMYAAPGIGLAAIQVGVPQRIIVMDLAREASRPSRATSSIPKSCGRRRRPRPMRRAASPCLKSTTRWNGPRG